MNNIKGGDIDRNIVKDRDSDGARAIKEIKDQMIKIGRACLVLGLQNSHCGNLSARVEDEIFITKSGSMKGLLEERDIIAPGLYEPKTGLFQASSETGTHRRILEYSGAVIHAHSLPATLISFISDEVTPLDFLGKRFLDQIPVVEFEYPVGSREMELRIPEVLKDHVSMIIKTHGPLTRGSDLFEAFFLMSLVDYCSDILLNMRMVVDIPDIIRNLSFPVIPDYSTPGGFRATKDEELITQFKKIGSILFSLKLSPFHTGSISVRDGKEMLYAPGASSPNDLDTDILRININDDVEDYFVSLHQSVYRYSHSQAAIFSHSPFGVVQSFKALIRDNDRIIPVDAEGGYLYPAIPVMMPDENLQEVIKKAESYKMVVLAGMGCLAMGQTPGHCIHHNSSLRNICFLKTQLELMERVDIAHDIDRFLDKRGLDW